MSEGFTDLRLNSQEGQVQESFWPSFTDIMTTIVMIFLIAMVVLLVRNMELVNQLRSTMEAETIAAELARATGEEKDSLSIALHQAERRTQQMHLEIERLQEKGINRETIISEQLTAIADLSNQRDDLTQRAAQLMLIRQRLEAEVDNRKAQLHTATQSLENRDFELASARTDIKNLRANLGSLENSLQTSQNNAIDLQNQIARQRQALELNRQASQDIERKYLVLVGDHDNLQTKYDKLVRPARSSKGRHLIEVRYWKEGDQYKITWREGNVSDYQPIKRKHLDAILTRLKKEHEDGLYVKVIFPENSGLSYNQAWEFTSHMHKNYDYYFKGNDTQ